MKHAEYKARVLSWPNTMRVLADPTVRTGEKRDQRLYGVLSLVDVEKDGFAALYDYITMEAPRAGRHRVKVHLPAFPKGEFLVRLLFGETEDRESFHTVHQPAILEEFAHNRTLGRRSRVPSRAEVVMFQKQQKNLRAAGITGT